MPEPVLDVDAGGMVVTSIGDARDQLLGRLPGAAKLEEPDEPRLDSPTEGALDKAAEKLESDPIETGTEIAEWAGREIDREIIQPQVTRAKEDPAGWAASTVAGGVVTAVRPDATAANVVIGALASQDAYFYQKEHGLDKIGGWPRHVANHRPFANNKGELGKHIGGLSNQDIGVWTACKVVNTVSPLPWWAPAGPGDPLWTTYDLWTHTEEGKETQDMARRWGTDVRQDFQRWGNDVRDRPRRLMYAADDIGDILHKRGLNPSVVDVVMAGPMYVERMGDGMLTMAGLRKPRFDEYETDKLAGDLKRQDVAPRVSDLVYPYPYAEKTYRRVRSEVKQRENRALLPPTPREATDKGGSFVSHIAGRPGATETRNERSWGEKTERKMPDQYDQPDGRSCGPTAAAILLKYYGIDAGIGVIKDRAWTDENGMTMPSALEGAMETYGLPMKRHAEMSINDVVSLIRQDRPPILLVRSSAATWHYVVATGFDPETRKIQIVSPNLRFNGGTKERWLDADDLDRAWRGRGDLHGFRHGESFGPRTFVEMAGVRGRTALVPQRAPSE